MCQVKSGVRDVSGLSGRAGRWAPGGAFCLAGRFRGNHVNDEFHAVTVGDLTLHVILLSFRFASICFAFVCDRRIGQSPDERGTGDRQHVEPVPHGVVAMAHSPKVVLVFRSCM